MAITLLVLVCVIAASLEMTPNVRGELLGARSERDIELRARTLQVWVLTRGILALGALATIAFLEAV